MACGKFVLGAACGLADSCYVPNPLNATAKCGQGSVPNYAVYATTPEHVIAYIKLAVKHNLRGVCLAPTYLPSEWFRANKLSHEIQLLSRTLDMTLPAAAQAKEGLLFGPT